MKIALIGDVHANLPALEAVLQHARQSGAEEIWNVGDSIGYGAFPEEVIQRLRQEHVTSVIGNYDLKVLGFPKKRKKFKKHKRAEKFLAFQWAYDHLSPESRRYLRSLPEHLWLQVMGWEILIVHASLSQNEELLVPSTPKSRFKALAQIAAHQNPHEAGIDMIVFGHSHQPFTRRIANVWFINTGSVGRPGDGNPRACYALLELDAASIHVEHFRIEYDIEAAVLAIRNRGLPEAFAQMLVQGVELEEVLME
jgi:putative phosphoesterase